MLKIFGSPSLLIEKRLQNPVLKNLKLLFYKHLSIKKLKQLKNQLINWKKAEFVRMTGSGSTLVMYFNSNETAKNALKTSPK